jgi:hypothetical protein
MTPLPFVGNWLQAFSSSVFILFLYESITLKLRMGHCSLIAFAMFASLCSSLVSLSRAWMAGSSEFSNVMPCLSAELVARTSIFGMPSPPSLLLQYSRPFGVLMGRCRTTFTWLRMVWSMARRVLTGGVARTVWWRKCGIRCVVVRDSFWWGFS